MTSHPTPPPPGSGEPPFSPLRWRDGALELIDQTLLPTEETWIRCTRVEEVADAIYRLSLIHI